MDTFPIEPLNGTPRPRLKECDFVNRKLIRPSLSEVQDQMNAHGGMRKKPAPPEQTNAESFYYLKQMQARTPMVVVLNSGEVLHGAIEWYDKLCIKVNRVNEPNLMVMKHAIRYMYKEGDSKPGGNGNYARENED
jgi:host factor-I protein